LHKYFTDTDAFNACSRLLDAMLCDERNHVKYCKRGRPVIGDGFEGGEESEVCPHYITLRGIL